MAVQDSRMDPSSPLRPHPPLTGYYRAAENRRVFVRDLFDHTAGDYDRIERVLAVGSGSWYRRRALARAGLRPGMQVLDVAMGTGLVAREAARLTGAPDHVIGLDPSYGMVREALSRLPVRAVLGRGEQLPLKPETFDFLSMGYALRHVSDLDGAFREFFRVLRPEGRVCLLEISRPRSRFSLGLLRLYMKRVVPWIARRMTGHPESARLMEYYWDTTQSCVAPEVILAALERAGFSDVHRDTELGIFSAYTATRPTES